MKRLAICLLLITSCSSIDLPVVEETPLRSSFPDQAWTDHALKAVMSSGLKDAKPSDGKEYCQNGMSPENFVVLLSAMARFESNYNPELEYIENFKDRNGNYIISTGLLQISQESAKGYGCKAYSQTWLKNVENNLSCSVAILERWIVRDGVISGKSGNSWRGGARYWSVLRYKLSEIKKIMKPYCI